MTRKPTLSVPIITFTVRTYM